MNYTKIISAPPFSTKAAAWLQGSGAGDAGLHTFSIKPDSEETGNSNYEAAHHTPAAAAGGQQEAAVSWPRLTRGVQAGEAEQRGRGGHSDTGPRDQATPHHCTMVTSTAPTHQLTGILLLAALLHPAVTRGGEAELLDIFQERLQVARCRAGCGLRYEDGAGRAQCGAGCQLAATQPRTWARVCRAPDLCAGPCLAACSLHTARPLSLAPATAARPRYTRQGGLVTLAGEAGAVYTLVARDGAGAWYELGQAGAGQLELVARMVETFLVRVTAAGEVTVTELRTDSDTRAGEEFWELYLGSIEQEGEIFQVEVVWGERPAAAVEGSRYSVVWSVGTVAGHQLTNQSRAELPVAPGSRVTVQVRDLATRRTSDSLTLDTPDTASSEAAAGSLGSVVAGAALLGLAIILGVVISLYRRTAALTSHSSQSLAQERDKSIISFDTFLNKNQISIPDFHNTQFNVNVDLYVI